MSIENVEVERGFLQQYTCLLEDWIPKDASMAIALDNHYVYYMSGLHDIQLKEGQPIKKGSIADTVLQTRKKVDLIVDRTLFGKPYYGIGYPIEIRGKAGALIIILPPNYHVLKNEPIRMLTGKLHDEWYPVPLEQITHIESYQKKTFFYTEGEQYTTNCTLKELHLKLPSSFLRIHRSYIINLSCIDKISRDFSSNLLMKMKDGAELPISQTYLNDVKSTLCF
ncbi:MULTISPECIES: LytTR family DNA-binding domain-containing protein [Sporosarcina]|uniref:LytTR family DNA-binding domain-containing protein n=1 Tax=Sporosarcina contaminans TaxID=633403 RepID=A0ABW3TZN7_9BACL